MGVVYVGARYAAMALQGSAKAWCDLQRLEKNAAVSVF